MKKSMVILALVASLLVSGCNLLGKGGDDGISSIMTPFIGQLKAEISQGAFIVQQIFSKVLAQEIVLEIREKNTQIVIIKFIYDKYPESGLFDEKITVLFDKSGTYEAALFIGDNQTEWIEFATK